MKYDLLSFGEAMIRLSPPGQYRLEQAMQLEMSVGGAELSVAAGVSRLGLRSAWVSRLPDHPLGRMIENKGREFGVDMRHVAWAPGERAGLYFVEHAAAPRPTRVYYDRKNSAFAHIRPGMIDWHALLRETRLLHVGGITPALSPSAADVQWEAIRAARSAGCLVSYDLNYRAALWTLEEARAAQLPMMEFVDVLVTSLPDETHVTELISGLAGSDPAEVARRLADRFDFKAVLVTLRGMPSVRLARWDALAFVNGDVHRGPIYDVDVVDRLGGGDACVAGFLTGYLEGDAAHGIALGNAFSALTQTSPTDWPWPTRSEVEALIADNSKRMAR